MGVGASFVKKRVRNGRTRWVIDFYYANKQGQRVRFVRYADLQTRDGADREARQLYERATLTGSPDVEQRDVMALSKFYEETFLPKVLPLYRKNTQTRYKALWRQRVRDQLGGKQLDEIDEQVLRGFARGIELDKRQPKGPVNFVRTLLREAERAGIIAKAPSLPSGCMKESKKLPEAPTLETTEHLLESAGGWLKVAAALGIYAGLRSGEIRALEVGDVDLESGVILVRRTLSEDEEETPKGMKERCVPLIPQLARILAEAMAGKPLSQRFIVTATGVTPRRQGVLTTWVRLQQRLGLPRTWSIHALRHGFCSQLVRVGAGVEAVRALAGHSSISVTNRYVHATGADLRSAMQRGFAEPSPGNQRE
jgi:integrase